MFIEWLLYVCPGDTVLQKHQNNPCSLKTQNVIAGAVRNDSHAIYSNLSLNYLKSKS